MIYITYSGSDRRNYEITEAEYYDFLTLATYLKENNEADMFMVNGTYFCSIPGCEGEEGEIQILSIIEEASVELGNV